MNAPGLSRDTNAGPVSWRRAWRRGLRVALHHRVLLALVAVALLCERALTLSATLDPGLRAFWSVQLERVMAAGLHSAPAAAGAALEDLPWPLLLVVLLLFVGMLLLIGVVTLIRDLLLAGRYRTGRVLQQGGSFFWPVVRYKLPIYLLGSVFSLGIATILWNLRGSTGSGPLAAAAGLALLWLAGFAVARVFLSLGTKVIVTEAPIGSAAVYRRIARLVRPQLGSVVVFYALVLALTGATSLAVWALSMLPAPAPLRAAVAVALLAAVTLIMKAAAFDLYLQLADRSRRMLPAAD